MKGLLVIDMQKQLVKDAYKQDLVSNVKKLLDRAREKNVPIIHLKYIGLKQGLAFEKWGALCVEGTEGAQILDEVKPLDNETLIERHQNSGYYNSNLEKVLREKDIDELIVVGVFTEYCVLATCLDSFFRNIKTYIVEQATCAGDKSIEKTVLGLLNEFSSEVIDLEKAVKLMER